MWVRVPPDGKSLYFVLFPETNEHTHNYENQTVTMVAAPLPVSTSCK